MGFLLLMHSLSALPLLCLSSFLISVLSFLFATLQLRHVNSTHRLNVLMRKCVRPIACDDGDHTIGLKSGGGWQSTGLRGCCCPVMCSIWFSIFNTGWTLQANQPGHQEFSQYSRWPSVLRCNWLSLVHTGCISSVRWLRCWTAVVRMPVSTRVAATASLPFMEFTFLHDQ